MQAEIFCTAAQYIDLTQVVDSIAASVSSLGCTDELRNRLCRNSSDQHYHRIASSYLYLSKSFLFLSNSLSLSLLLTLRTIISSLSHLFLRAIPHPCPIVFIIRFLCVHVELKSPIFLAASVITLNHSLFVSLFLSETCRSFLLSLSLFLFIIFYLHFYLFDNKSLCLSLLSFPSLSTSNAIHSFILHPIQFLSVSLSLPKYFIRHLPVSISTPFFCAVHLISFYISITL